MICRNCGAEVEDGQVICPACGQELQIVPDYNPLDEMLAAQVKGALSQTMVLRQEREREARGQKRPSGRTGSIGRTPDRTGAMRTGGGRVSPTTQRVGSPGKGQTGADRSGRAAQEDREKRRRQMEKKRQQAKKRLLRRLLVMAALAAVLIAAAVLLYMRSYAGLIRSGDRYLEAKEYEKAEEKFTRALKKNRKRGEAYTGLAGVYIAKDRLDEAEQLFLEAIEDYSSNVELYRAAIQFYCDSGQEAKVSELLDDCTSAAVLDQLKEFLSDTPQFSLDETTEYDEVQALELRSNGEAIYYTTNGERPTVKTGTKYTEPIRLDEGETEVQAISVNEKGIPSLVVSRTYKVTFPIADAPAVSPSTGQYDSPRTIEVVVPSNYEAYYTTDGTTPTKSSYPYTGPIDMPMGKTIFSVVLVDQSGRLSDVTIRNYERTE